MRYLCACLLFILHAVQYIVQSYSSGEITRFFTLAHRRKADEVQILEDTIRARNEQHKKAGVELDATCHICLKTKFADGVGHLCNYCSIRCCARCGGKVTLRSNKVSVVSVVCVLFDGRLAAQTRDGSIMTFNLSVAPLCNPRRLRGKR